MIIESDDENCDDTIEKLKQMEPPHQKKKIFKNENANKKYKKNVVKKIWIQNDDTLSEIFLFYTLFLVNMFDLIQLDISEISDKDIKKVFTIWNNNSSINIDYEGTLREIKELIEKTSLKYEYEKLSYLQWNSFLNSFDILRAH